MKAVQVVTAATVALWAQIPELTQLLVLLMAVDVVLGVIKAIHERDLSAAQAWSGVTKKVVVLLLVGVAGLLNPYIQEFVQINLVQAASAFYIVPELASITRNAAALNVPMFVQMAGVMRYFQAASGDTDGDGVADDDAGK